MIIKILYDNQTLDERFQAGWGFSCWIEYGEHRILFDTGNDLEAFWANVQALQIDISLTTQVVFSHKHKDHVTGCTEILAKLHPQVPVYVPKGFPVKKIPSHLDVHVLDACTEVRKGLYCFPLRGGLFLFEQCLVAKTSKGLVVVTGCAHPGIVAMLDKVQEQFQTKIHLVLGGFHQFKSHLKTLQNIVQSFEDREVETVAPCHCSGDRLIAAFQESYRDVFYRVGSGKVLVIEPCGGDASISKRMSATTGR